MSRVTEPLSWSEIRRRFPDRWVALLEVDWLDEAAGEIRSALVAGFGERRWDAMTRSRRLRSRFELVELRHTGA